MTASLKDLERFMDAILRRTGVSGMDCAIYQEHQEIFRYSAGFADMEAKKPVSKDALYNIYSATKIITCVAAMQLVERGLMLLSDPLYEYLPEFRDMKVKTGTFVISEAKQHIRIIDLFTMTAGLSYELDTPHMRDMIRQTCGDFSTRDFVRTLAKEPLLFEPGTGWNYSYCHDVLGAVIEVVSGMPFGEYLEKNIFIPLGMKDTGFSVPEEKRDRIAPQYEYSAETCSVKRIGSDCIGAAGLRHESGGGGLISSTDDYILFIDALACGGTAKNGEKIISENTINLMRRNRMKGVQMEAFRSMTAAEGIGYGLGVAVVMDPAADGRLLPANAFYWGGLGGVQDLVDPSNRISYFVAQHTIKSPKKLIEPYMLNILYASL